MHRISLFPPWQNNKVGEVRRGRRRTLELGEGQNQLAWRGVCLLPPSAEVWSPRVAACHTLLAPSSTDQQYYLLIRYKLKRFKCESLEREMCATVITGVYALEGMEDWAVSWTFDLNSGISHCTWSIKKIFLKEIKTDQAGGIRHSQVQWTPGRKLNY